ncbi:MAG: hypothetical protein V5A64_03845 [Candidatus Thermoplasmatota archaeon]
MIKIIGIDHTEKRDDQLKKIIYSFKPDAICVELDELSFKIITGQLTEEQVSSYFSDIPLTFKLLSLYKDKSQKVASVDRMWDSKLVYKLSKNLDFEIIPIDIDKKKIYSEVEKNISFSEKIKVLIEVFKKLFFSEEKMKKSNESEKRFPVLKKYLIDKRNEYMYNEIRRNARFFKKIIVLIGNNHLIKLKNLSVEDEEDIELIHLKALREI